MTLKKLLNIPSPRLLLYSSLPHKCLLELWNKFNKYWLNFNVFFSFFLINNWIIIIILFLVPFFFLSITFYWLYLTFNLKFSFFSTFRFHSFLFQTIFFFREFWRLKKYLTVLIRLFLFSPLLFSLYHFFFDSSSSSSSLRVLKWDFLKITY